jgi:RecB family endonuclease NucS
MRKADGCIAIHADGGAYKPLNWMNAPNTVVEHDEKWVVTNPKGEVLTIYLHEVFSDMSHELGEDPGLTKDGVEAHLQELLAALPESIEAGLTLKRRGEIDGVEQLTRYIDCLHADTSLGKIRGIFVAQSIKPQARVLAESRGMGWCEVDYDELRGKRTDELRLF